MPTSSNGSTASARRFRSSELEAWSGRAAPARLVAVKFRTWISKITLSALALGAFFSCGPKQPQDPYPQDRVVNIIGNPVPSNLDSTWLAAHKDSSGWTLHWTLPPDTAGK